MEAVIKDVATQRVSRKYARAPITEAIIEIRVKPAPSVTVASCKPIFEEIRDQFSEVKDLVMMQAEIGPQIEAHAVQSVVGYVLRSDRLQQIVTVTPDKFAFSQLRPYDRWEAFLPACRHLWDVYVASLRPEKITRVGTGFVNRIEIPMPVADLRDYFRTVPEISPDMQQELAGAFLQLQLPQKDIGCMAVLNEAVLQASASTVPVILDIDVFDESQEYDVGDKIWAKLDEFRWRKNQIFEACITDKVRNLIS